MSNELEISFRVISFKGEGTDHRQDGGFVLVDTSGSERTMNAPASSLLPTPTASSYGSCRGGGMGRVGKWRHSLHSLKILHPHDWERMMGFPIGWTAVES